MTAREKITFNWSPKNGERTTAADDYIECAEDAPSGEVCVTEMVMQMPSGPHIRDRLKNWARWVDWCERRELRGGGTDCMTGLICDRLRRARLGNVWSGPPMPKDIDEPDAELIELAWRKLLPRYKKLLQYRYLHNWKPEFICKRLDIKRYPDTVFLIEQVRAEEAIEKAAQARG